MYLHLGNDVIVRDTDILGIFDMDTATMKKSTPQYLEKLQALGNLVDVTEKLLPKSVVIVKTKSEEKAYLSSLSTITLQKRLKEKYCNDGNMFGNRKSFSFDEF